MSSLPIPPIGQVVQWPWLLALALVLPILGWLALRAERRSRARRIEQLGTGMLFERLAPLLPRHTPWHTIRVTLALLLIGVALAGPRWGIERMMERRSGVDVALVLDASLSMLAQDVPPSRLEEMKGTVRRLRMLSPDDRFALLAFAQRSYILTPLTTDDDAIGLYLDNLDPSVVGEGGTTLATAIRQATNLLTLGKGEGDKVIVLMSDGEGFEGQDSLVDAAKRVAAAGIQLITVGFGTERGATIPIVQDGVRTLKKDENGQTVVTRYSPELLGIAAQAAGGVFIPANAENKAALIRRVLDRLKASPRAVSTGENLSPQFGWFVAPALLLLLIDVFAALRLRRPQERERAAAKAKTAAVAAAAATLMTSCTPRDAQQRVAQYNRGTDLLERDSLVASLPPLDSAMDAKDSLVHFRAAFNSGLTYLVTARRVAPDRARHDSAEAMFDSTLAHYHAALVAAPNDMDAKWNYELALRDSSGAGGGGGGGGGVGGSQNRPQPQNPQSSNAGQREALAILNSADREEHDVQGRQQRKNTPSPPHGRDW